MNMTAKEKKPNAEKELKIRFKRTKKFYNEHKKIFWALLIILTIIIFSLGAKIVLYMNLLLGNDIILTLSTEKQDFTLKNGETQNITFLAKVKTNPFCKAVCTASYEDISKGLTLQKYEFELSPQNPIKLNYMLKADMLGIGQKLYRETLVCRSSETTLCQTLGDNTSRSILITLNYELNDNEKKLNEELSLRLNDSKRYIESSYAILTAINNSFSNDTNLSEIKNILSEMERLKSEIILKEMSLEQLHVFWENSDYGAITKNQLLELPETKETFDSLYALSNATVTEQNLLKEEYDYTNEVFLNLSKIKIDNNNFIDSLKSDFEDYNSLKLQFEESDSLGEKREEMSKIKSLVTKIDSLTTDELNLEIRLKKEKLVNTYARLCELGHDCIDTRYLRDMSDLGNLCAEATKLNAIFAEIKRTPPVKSDSTANMTKEELDKLKKLLQDIKDGKISPEAISQNSNIDNSALLNFVQTPLDECDLDAINVTIGQKKDIKKMSLVPITQYNINLSFENQSKQCCIKGECSKCCGNGLCENKDYPLLFIHGHSFNKRLESDYSLDAFNKLQDNLELQEYLNAGAISMYSPMNETDKVWREIPKSLSIKVSYYYDLFKTQEDYVLIQTKSENLDTYALRLNDLINTILKKTGKKKVTIISHSMGGLVTRRYIQIFGGDKIDKFIMVATPNYGVTGTIADYCTLVGEEQECKDLQDDSLFLNKLNRDKIPGSVESYVIYGSGCDMDGEDGDGVVTVKSAKLEYTNNIEIKGNCTGINTLHTDLLDIDKYPEVYKEISKILD